MIGGIVGPKYRRQHIPAVSTVYHELAFLFLNLTFPILPDTRIGSGYSALLDVSVIRRFELLCRFRDEGHQGDYERY